MFVLPLGVRITAPDRPTCARWLVQTWKTHSEHGIRGSEMSQAPRQTMTTIKSVRQRRSSSALRMRNFRTAATCGREPSAMKPVGGP